MLVQTMTFVVSSLPFNTLAGIPEHATSLSLPTTAEGTAEVAPHYSEPYRLYNLDVFEYEIGECVCCFGGVVNVC